MLENLKPITLNEDNFQQEVLEASQPVLVDFWAAWCGPCRLMNPIVQQLAIEFTGQVKVAKANVDDYPTIASHYHISAIPSLMLFKDGQVVDLISGMVTKEFLTQKLTNLLHNNSSSQELAA
ncbi:thioredoxin [Aetokthonos hydrillicola Thurmond2011]|uniref:Thioredoxin n=1 Tax=Aetokthonos hydrillicola Thurmond2011 TaxID=2712845 RepID=A0AAP5IF09_9CYAN|nr:thioredoxin [Aetokthonos hydrillicola]MBO3458500.1 thioredoxin [Aetokthonos hydrillicola CCALA 1050]MBW4586173.1 thioredoxin [Aetokthonos hydrillicola CCALA 1050]MDR9897780.1 thioredoxin [Aetokthonos hydrillicola Thurmond2011]